MPVSKKLKLSPDIIYCQTCGKVFYHVDNYNTHLMSTEHFREVTGNQAKARKINRRLAYELERAESVKVPKLCLNCVCLKTSNALFKYCNTVKDARIKTWVEEKMKDVYFKADSSIPTRPINKRYYCNICKLRIRPKRTSKVHYGGKLHLKNLLKAIKSQLSCDVCGNITVIFNMDEKAFMRESVTKKNTTANTFNGEYMETEDEISASRVKTETFSDFKTENIDIKTECVEVDIKQELISEKIEYTDADLKRASFVPDIKTDFSESDEKTEFTEADIKTECFEKDVKTDFRTDFVEKEDEILVSRVKTEALSGFKSGSKEGLKADKIAFIEADHCASTKTKFYNCGVCNVTFISSKVFKAHYLDDAHTKKHLGMIQDDQCFYCGLCDFVAIDDDVFREHLKHELHLDELI